MLTRHGWTLAIGGAAMAVAGRLFAIFELFVLGTAALGLVIITAIWVGLARLKVSVTRSVHPVRVHAGTPARVDLRITNLGRTTPVLRVRDPVAGTRGADISVGPLKSREQARASYAIPTERRGAIGIGPMRIDITDPFGLASVKIDATGSTTLTVYPRVDLIAPIPFSAGHDPHGGAHDAQSLGRVGEEFYALRDYSVGDDLRRVHWPSTARRGQLMVRQDELPWQGRVTILLDTRATAHNNESFEGAVSAAASVISASSRRRDMVRLVTTHGGDSGFGTGRHHVDSMFEYLATVSTSNRGTFQASLSELQKSGDGGAVVAILGRPHQTDVDRVGQLTGRAGALAVVRFTDAEGDGATAGSAGPSGNKMRSVIVPEGTRFSDAWDRVVGPAPLGASS
ncbi:MAG: DUF58 domain-containing protein [Actinomycetota bacterium]|jgi:uncharacterized protein (DUF58 family)|nr:DUF58 domain-containing protein [Actinomycetota bacterium]